MTFSDLIGNGANLATVLAAVFAVLMFAWRVLRRLAQIVKLLHGLAGLKATVDDLGRRIAILEHMQGIDPLNPGVQQ